MKTAIMATGGIDSTLLMYEPEWKQATIISVNYEQILWKHQKELILHHMQEVGNKQPFIELQMPLFSWQKTPGLFEENWYPETGADDLESFDNIPHASYFIEGRNAIMLCYALAYCAAHGIDELIVGYEYEKEEWENIRSTKMIADDTSPHFLDTMNILALSGFSKVVRIRAPFYEQRMDKEQIIKKCLEYGINLDKTYSCYFWPGPCGKCDNCLLKQRALKRIKDNG
jgi:7-cyano-7-deazaguanine synthase in queuosine biosynthesis